MDTVMDLINDNADKQVIITNDDIHVCDNSDNTEREPYDIYGLRVLISDLADLTQIGQGAYSTVYKIGEHQLCFKAFKRTYGSIQEISVVNLVSGLPNVVSQHGVDWSIRGILMKQYKQSLASVLYREVSQTTLKQYMYDILVGVYNLHSRGIIYRDVKPHNILVENGRAYITDFGMSTFYLYSSHAHFRSWLTHRVANHAYTPPEVVYGLLGKDRMPYSASVDMASIGYMFMEMIYGKSLCSIVEKPHGFMVFSSLLNANTFKCTEKVVTRKHVFNSIALIELYRGSEYCERLCRNITSINSLVLALLHELHTLVNNPTKISIYKSKMSSLEFDLISRMTYSVPSMRITCEQALNHQFFDDIRTNHFESITIKSILASIPEFPYKCIKLDKYHKLRYFTVSLNNAESMNCSYFSLVYGFYIFKSCVSTQREADLDRVILASLYIANSITDRYRSDVSVICPRIRISEREFTSTIEVIMKALNGNAIRRFSLLVILNTIQLHEYKLVLPKILKDVINLCFVDDMSCDILCECVCSKYIKRLEVNILSIPIEPIQILNRLIKYAAAYISIGAGW